MKAERVILTFNLLIVIALLSLVSFRFLQTGDNAKLLTDKIGDVTKTVNTAVHYLGTQIPASNGTPAATHAQRPAVKN